MQRKYGDYSVYTGNTSINERDVNRAVIPLNSTTHFVSPDPIKYVDISSNDVHGDLPEKNIFRLKPDTSKVHPGSVFTVTIVTSSFITVYKLQVTNNTTSTDGDYVITLNPNNGLTINQADVLNRQQCFDLALKAFNKKRSIYNIKTKSYGLDFWINNIYSFGDYIMLDVGAKNNTKLQFGIDQIRFKVIDKHILNATISQDIEFKPYYALYPAEGAIIKNHWRNFYIFKKFTFPAEKLFEIQLDEVQYSGRKLDLKFEYNQLLKSESIY